MLTNQLKVSWNLEQIKRDFFVYHITAEKPSCFTAMVLDDFWNRFKAKSIRYFNGKEAYILLTKPLTREQKKSYYDLIIKEVNLDEEFYENVLLQLLINTLSYDRDSEYQNTIGTLLCHIPNKSESDLTYLSIRITRDLCLVADVKTFQKDKDGDYCVDEITGDLRKYRKNEAGVRYGKKHRSTKTIVPVLDIQDFSSYRHTKMGILAELMMDVRRKLSSYISLEFMALETEMFPIRIQEKDYLLYYKRIPEVIIINKTDYKEDALLETLKSFGVAAKSGSFQEDAYHICMIHNAEYYKDSEDQYSKMDHIVQHITVENFFPGGKNESSIQKQIVKKVLLELLIKRDLHYGCITMQPWEADDCWFFAMRERIEKDHYCYHRLCVFPDGQLKYENTEYPLDDVWDKIINAYDMQTQPEGYFPHQIDGVFFEHNGAVHSIYRTDKCAYLHIEKIWNALRIVNPSDAVPINLLIAAMETFLEDFPVYQREILTWKQKLSDLEIEEETRKKIGKIISMRSNAGKAFNTYLWEKEGIALNALLRNASLDYGYESVQHLHWCAEKDGYSYCLGSVTKETKYPRYSVIRKIVTTGSVLSEEDIQKMLSVAFVRNQSYTVLPYLYKYLREFIRKCN